MANPDICAGCGNLESHPFHQQPACTCCEDSWHPFQPMIIPTQFIEIKAAILGIIEQEIYWHTTRYTSDEKSEEFKEAFIKGLEHALTISKLYMNQIENEVKQ